MGVNRRSFIRYASLAAAGSAAGLRPFGALNSLAQSASGYKALVCVFLFGGNDANNTLIQFDTAGYASYSSIRGPLALPQSSLIQLAQAPNFALNSNLPDIAKLFDSKSAALVTNVGTLVTPLTKAQYQATGSVVPTNLFSHPDQQLEWQNASQSGSTSTGWAGRIADTLTTSYNPGGTVPMITSVAGDTLFCNGAASTPVSVSPGNLGGASCSEGTTECAAQQATAQALLQFDSGLSLVQADNTITNNAYTYAKILTAATASLPALQTVFPTGNSLASQLKQIAQIIQARSALGGEPADILCELGELRYALGPGDVAECAAGFTFAGAGGVLSGYAGAWCGEQCDDVYDVGLQPDVSAEFEYGERPCMGIAPYCAGWGGERWHDVWEVSDAGAGWAG